MPFPRFPDPPPVVVGAVFTQGTGTLVVSFDRALQAASLDVGNWFLRFNGRSYTIVTANAGAGSGGGGGGMGGEVTIAVTIAVIDAGANVVSYSPPPFDVVSVQGVPAEGFSDFPVTS